MTATALSRCAPASGSKRRGRWPVVVGAILLIGIAAACGILLWDNPARVGSRAFWTILSMRAASVGTIVVVGISQGVATLVFQTVTGNRLLTPSILGFDALYRLIQTLLVFLFSTSAFAVTDGIAKIALQSALMVVMATLLYGWLFRGRLANLHLMLLAGVILGMAFGSLSTFMQRLLTPSEFDVLTARLYGNISAARPEYLPWCGAAVLVVLVVVWRRRHVLDVVSLGPEIATNLGVNFRREVTVTLILVSLLISMSVSLVGPMTFLGFVVVTMTYQIVGAQDHGRLLPTAGVVGVTFLLVASFILQHVFYAQGVVNVVIELIGGSLFLIFLLRKGTL